MRSFDMKYKVLVIDDEAEIRKTIRLQLDGTIYEVLEAEGVEKAIELLEGENLLEVVTIICDVRIPKIDGVEAVAYFHKNCRSLPIIMLTGYPDVQLAIDFMKSGVVDYLVKPVEKDKLVEAVHKAARKFTLFKGPQPKV
jgi:two-component system chemotaxis response regulator CheY|tara:strand:- start:1784 stop:2203 length:420 start_codon:yes stop_codon:yes gene_type:complete